MAGRVTALSRRALLGSALALAVTSCSDGGSGASSSPGTGALTRISVGLLPNVDVAPVYVGIQRGFFRSRGLQVTAQQFQGGSAMVPAVISGQVQVGFSNVVSLLAARDRGVPLVSVAGGSSSTGDRLRDINAVMVGKGSRLRSARDLVGRKVAINSWNNLGDTTVKVAVRKDGGNDWKVQFVRLPFPDMPAKLADGTVDAVWVPEPFRSAILSAGGRILFDNLTETYPRVQIAQYFATEQLRRDRPGVVSAFVAGLKESMAYAVAHPREVQQVIGTYVKVSPTIASMMVLPAWSADLDAESTAVLGRAAHDFGTLAGAADVSGLLAGA